MLKRFYSKRSGFTLVEIIIAFAVFALMASMIVQLLNLSVSARTKNVSLEREFDSQEHLLTLVEKNSENYGDPDGTMKITFDNGTEVSLEYDKKSAAVNADNDGEGLNYFLAPVNYQSNGEVNPNMGGDGTGGSNSGSQMSRLDTRITGTTGIKSIEIRVVKDTHNYDEGDPMAVPAGHTRYFIEAAASTGSKSAGYTMKAEDVPYSQYRLYFYHQPDPSGKQEKSEYLNMAASSVEYTDSNGNKYTKDVYKTAVITKVGYLNNFNTAKSNGLQSSNIIYDVSDTNKYTIEQMGTNVIRIGSPFTKGNGDEGGLDGNGVRFMSNFSTKFYIEFEGDPNLTAESFGYNAVKGVVTGSKLYTACPNYKDDYNDDGTPTYDADDKHVNIYGAFLQTRHYKK